MPALIAAGTGKTMGKDATFEVFAKRLSHKGLGGVMVALAVELTCAGKFQPGLEVFGNGWVQQGALGVARVVELGFGARLRARVRMQVRLRWTCGGGHGAVPAEAGCSMVLCLYLYPDMRICDAARWMLSNRQN